MVFSSIVFLFYFLPGVLLLNFLPWKKAKNLTLLLASLLFYAWGEGIYVFLMLTSVFINYTSGRLIDSRCSSCRKKAVFIVAIVLNLAILGYFKYASFLVENLNLIFTTFNFPIVNLEPVRLPIGISFFTFQALSYVIDVYQKRVSCQKNIIDLALYIALFPQLIAGPIVRYNDIVKEIASRTVTISKFSAGVARFIFGLSKKVLLANPLAEVADTIFAMPSNELSLSLCWLGTVAYTLQIYFDFSGYSDMAIGLGRMFGFTFLENFNYPYISQSIREFWRRWHISLSSWLRDYVYIPLGGNRKGAVRTYVNLITVFLLCGLWHGASWTFVLWGAYHGFFLMLERTPYGVIQEKLWKPLRIASTLIVVMVGWVIFRSETFMEAMTFLWIMAGGSHDVVSSTNMQEFVTNKMIFDILCAMMLALPIYPAVSRKISKLFVNAPNGVLQSVVYFGHYALLIILFYFSIITLAAGIKQHLFCKINWANPFYSS